MSANAPPEHPKFEVAEDPAPRTDVVDVEEDEESKRARDAALASTFDQTLAHNGKTDEELIEERQDEARLIMDAVIAAGVVIAVAENQNSDAEDAEPFDTEANDDDGGE